MTKYEFKVHQVPVVGQQAQHTWEAEDISNGKRFPLPKGGRGDLLGKYPEISEHLKSTHKKGIDLEFRGTDQNDGLNLRYAEDDYVWTFRRGSDEIVVHDIPRTVALISFLK